MSRDTRTIQIAVSEEQYQELARLAAHDHKTVKVVVWEALEQICLRKRRA